MAKTSRAAKQRNAQFQVFLTENAIQPVEPQTKKFSMYDLNKITPMTRNQELTFDLWRENHNLILAGSAGCGKTFLSIYLAMRDILDPRTPYEKLIIFRSAVPTRDMGFVKGTQEEKTAVYEMAYHQIFDEIFPKIKQYQYLKAAGLVDFQTTSYVRGVTFNNAIVIFDEFQSANFHELFTVATRIGQDSKIIFCGDAAQNDLLKSKNDQSGFQKFIKVASYVPEFRQVTFTREDIVRSEFVKSLIIASEKYDELNTSKT